MSLKYGEWLSFEAKNVAKTIWQSGSVSTCWGSLQRSPGLVAGFEETTAGKKMGGEGGKEQGMRGKRMVPKLS